VNAVQPRDVRREIFLNRPEGLLPWQYFGPKENISASQQDFNSVFHIKCRLNNWPFIPHFSNSLFLAVLGCQLFPERSGRVSTSPPKLNPPPGTLCGAPSRKPSPKTYCKSPGTATEICAWLILRIQLSGFRMSRCLVLSPRTVLNYAFMHLGCVVIPLAEVFTEICAFSIFKDFESWILSTSELRPAIFSLPLIMGM
jgi:hypothetical protein